MTPTQLLLPLPKKTGWHKLPLVVSAQNADTIALLERPEQWQDGVLSLVGGQGSGKSFIAWYLFDPASRIASSASSASPDSGAQRHRHIGRIIDKNNLAGLGQEKLPPDQVVIWDNVDNDLAQLSAASAEGLCHFFNQPKSARPKLLLLSQRPLPWLLQQHRQIILPDLASRLSLVAGVELLADDESLRAQMFGFFAERQVAVDDKIIASILRHAPRSHDGLHQLLARLDDFSLRTKKPIQRKMIQQWLGDEPDKD
ncbi:MAG: hypothetical protein QM529_04660 [Hydrotalea sp.]|nr:hypothetical protein [Hydrotalea sp.]